MLFMSILLKNIVHQQQTCDILIEGNKFCRIAPQIGAQAEQVIDGRGKAILPAFYNLHTHAAMSLLKGLGDDKELFSWLNEDIWPREAKLDENLIYIGTKLAILEMIKSGTVFFADMYMEQKAIMQAVNEMGVRTAVSIVGFDLFDPQQTKEKITAAKQFLTLDNPCPERICKHLAIHSIYTVSADLISFMAETAKQNDLFLHIHACETAKECADCQKQHGCSPIEYLEKLGALGPKTILAHAIHLSDNDIRIILKHRVTLVTNPGSNLKLVSGLFPFQKLINAGATIALGTDGSASNNNLSMIEEMKLCALAAKLEAQSPSAGKADEVYRCATQNGARAFGIEAGEICEGKLADCILVDLNNQLLTPNYNLVSNMVYAADSSVVDTVICNGKILMQNRRVPGEDEIISQAQDAAKKLIQP